MKFSVKTATWANDDSLSPRLTVKLLNYIWKLKLIRKIKLFAWKLIRDKIHTRGNLRKIGMDINTDCPYCQIS